MRRRSKGILTLSVLFVLSFCAALVGCGGNTHKPTLVASKAPTCTEAGYEEYYLCSHCDKLYSDEACKNEIAAPVALSALGHDMTKHDKEEATCTKPGNVEYYTCSREQGVYYANGEGTQTLEEIGVTVAHDLVANPAKDPTKDDFGRKPSWTCNSCHTMYGDEYGDKVVTEEDLKIDKIQETIDGVLSEEFYHKETAFAYGAANVAEGGLGTTVNATLASDGVYFHVVTNYNTPAAEQGGQGCVKIYINARNVDNKNLPGNAVASATQAIIMELYFDGTIPEGVYQHNPSTVRSCTPKTNEEGAPTKYTTTWEVYCSFADLAAANKSVLKDAFEKQADGKTVLKTGYNVLVTSVSCVINNEDADKFENNGSSACNGINKQEDDTFEWYLWSKVGYSDTDSDQRYMIVTPNGFSNDFVNLTENYAVKLVPADNVTLTGLPDTVAADGVLEGSVTLTDSYVFRGILINGIAIDGIREGSDVKYRVELAEIGLPWNTAELTITPVAVKDERQTVALTLEDNSKSGITALVDTEVCLTDGFGEPIKVTTDAKGVAKFENLLCTTYTLTIEGYPQEEIIVEKGTATAKLQLVKNFAKGSNDNIYIDAFAKTIMMDKPAALNSQKWVGNAEIATVSSMKTANVMFETTVSMSNTALAWGYDAQNQRLAIQLTKSGKGFAFWMWNNAGDRTTMGALNEDTLINSWSWTDIIPGSKELAYGWIYAAATGSNGLNLRLIREGDTLIAFAQHDDVWEKLGETSCGADDELQVKVYFAHASYYLTDTAVTVLGEHKSAQEPEVGNPGWIEHYVNGDKYYLPDGTPVTEEEVMLELKETAATVTLVLKDLDGEDVTVAEGTKVTVKSRFHNTTLTVGENGVLSGTLYVDEYTASLYGYKDVTFTVTESGEVMLIMNATLAYASNDQVTVNDENKTITIAEGLPADKSYTGNAEFVTDGALNNANVLFETTVKAINFEDGWTYKTTMQRFIIQITDTGKGVFFWTFNSGNDKANIKAINDLTNRENEGTPDLDLDKTTTEEQRGWVVPFVKGEGLKLRLVRNEDKIALYGYNGTKWVALGVADCGANDNLKICVYGTGCGWEFSQMAVTDLGEYVEEQDPVVGTPGHIAHFKKGDTYYLLDGTPATAEEIKTEVEASAATVTLVLKDLDGEDVTVAEGTKVTVKSRFHNTTLTVGENGVLSGTLYVDEYTASLYGYKDVTFTVTESGEVMLIMNATLAYASNDQVTVNDENKTITIAEGLPADKSYTGNAEFVTDGELKNANVVLETTVKAINFEDGWTYKTTMQRFIVQVTDSGKGFFFWTFNAEGNKANIQEISSLTNREVNSGKDLNGLTEKERGWIVPFIKSPEGLKLRIIRNGDTIALYAYNGTDWIGIGNMKCEATDDLKVCFYGTGCGWEFSQISVKEAENTEYTLNAIVKGIKAGVTTNLTEGATVRFTSLFGYDKTFTVGKDGALGGAEEKLPAGEYTVTVSGNSYAVYQKKLIVSAAVSEIVFDYESFSIVERGGSYDLYDFSHTDDENASIGVNNYVERFNALSTDKYDDVSVTLGGKFNNSMAGNRSQGIFIKFEDGKYMFLRFSWWDNQYKIEYMQGGNDTWNLPVLQDWSWDDVIKFNDEQTQKWTSNQEMKLQLVRSGNTLNVYLDGALVRTNELNAEYADDKVQVGFFAWDVAEDASWNFEISETLPKA